MYSHFCHEKMGLLIVQTRQFIMLSFHEHNIVPLFAGDLLDYFDGLFQKYVNMKSSYHQNLLNQSNFVHLNIRI